jgi:Arc/MetJ-type ribon-helix-helix transcriptional regulator
MASNHTLVTTPLTFELPRSLVDRIQACRQRLGMKSVSEVVRHSLERFDYVAFATPRREQLQISVRLSPGQKRRLFQNSRQKKVSAGELLRAALEALVKRPAGTSAGRQTGRDAARGSKSNPGKGVRKQLGNNRGR